MVSCGEFWVSVGLVWLSAAYILMFKAAFLFCWSFFVVVVVVVVVCFLIFFSPFYFRLSCTGTADS